MGPPSSGKRICPPCVWPQRIRLGAKGSSLGMLSGLCDMQITHLSGCTSDSTPLPITLRDEVGRVLGIVTGFVRGSEANASVGENEVAQKSSTPTMNSLCA